MIHLRLEIEHHGPYTTNLISVIGQNLSEWEREDYQIGSGLPYAYGIETGVHSGISGTAYNERGDFIGTRPRRARVYPHWHENHRLPSSARVIYPRRYLAGAAAARVTRYSKLVTKNNLYFPGKLVEAHRKWVRSVHKEAVNRAPKGDTKRRSRNPGDLRRSIIMRPIGGFR